jgi:hemolysin III
LAFGFIAATIALAGILTGLLMALFGIGGGAFIVPVLDATFARLPGVAPPPFKLAVLASLVAIGIGSSWRALQVWRRRELERDALGLLIGGALPGTLIGVALVISLAGDLLRLTFAGLPLLLTTAAQTGRVLPVATFSVYGSTLVLLYLCSTLYHSVRGGRKDLLQKLDHCAIFVLIAGTYTPIALCTLGGVLGWTIFGINWGLAVVGTVIEFVPWRHRRVISHILYVVMGWLALVAIGTLLRSMPPAGNVLIFAGGILYTGGIAVYAWERLPHHHGIWHLCVIGGSVCHFFAILLYVR